MVRMQQQLNRYHRQVGITHVDSEKSYSARFRDFRCSDKVGCKEACQKAFKGQTGFEFSPPVEAPEVSQNYENREYDSEMIPRIVVISLSVPKPTDNDEEGELQESIEPRSHWMETLAMVRSMIHPSFVTSKELAKPIVTWEDEESSMLKQLFVHVRTGKCCSNANGGGQEPYEVYETCGGFLEKEMKILQPDVIVTQGNPAHWETEEHVLEEGAVEAEVEKVKCVDFPIARLVSLKGESRPVYWLRSYFPSARNWPSYLLHAGPSENDEPGARRKNFTLYGREIKRLFDSSVLGPTS
ncbi:MAG: hypothetical protein OXG13_03285 [Gemmatimonadaceae bacterium]|nr:hypothetical protein [Gemmatimonadaceae bacterium]